MKAAKKKDDIKEAQEFVKEESPVQIVSKLSKNIDLFVRLATTISLDAKKLRFSVIELENRQRELRLKKKEAEAHLAAIEKKAQLALAQSNSGIRTLADRLAIERGEVEQLKAKLALQEKSMSDERRQLEELKASFETKLEGLNKVALGKE